MNKMKATLRHLQRYGSITPKKAIEIHSNYRLSDTIFKLRNLGHSIETEMQSFTDKHGLRTGYAKYKLENDGNKA